MKVAIKNGYIFQGRITEYGRFEYVYGGRIDHWIPGRECDILEIATDQEHYFDELSSLFSRVIMSDLRDADKLLLSQVLTWAKEAEWVIDKNIMNK